MALNKQVVPVSMGLSLDTKTDSKQVKSGLLKAENVFIKKTGELQKRNGYNLLNSTVLSINDPNLYVTGYPTPISSASSLSTFQDELVLASTTNIYSYSPDIEKWVDKGASIFVEVDTKQIQANSYQQTSGDVAVGNGASMWAWEDSRGGVRALLNDVSSGTQFLSDTLLNVDGERPRCISIGNYLFVFYYDSNTEELIARRVDALNPNAFGNEIVVGADINTTTPYFDVCVVGTRMIVVYLTTTNEIKLAYFLQSGAVGQPLNGVPAPISIAIDANWSIAVAQNDVGISIVFANSTDGIGHIAYNTDFTVQKTEIIIDSTLTNTFRNCTLIYNEELEGVEVFYEVEAAAAINNKVNYSLIDLSANTSSVPETLQRAAGLASKPIITDRATSVLVSYASTSGLQNTYFLINTLYEIEAKILNTLANGHTLKDSNVPGLWTSGSYSYIAVAQQSRIVTGTQETFLLVGLSQFAFNHSSNEIEGLPAELGENLHFAGGFVKTYDGQSVVEHNYHLYPEQPTITTDGSSGNVQTGTYLYKICFEWIDAKGQIHQSETSAPTSHSVSGNHTVSVVIPTLRYTAKQEPARSPIIMSVYRTEASGTIYYKVSDDSSPLFNDTSVDTVTFTDNIADATLISRQLLYTTGGVLENAPCPPCTVLTSAKNRIFASGLISSSTVAFSKEFVPEQGVAFSSLLTVQVPSRGGRITALIEMDDKLIIFKQTSIYSLSGDGPNSLGTGGEFTVNAVASDVGCAEPESVVLTPTGVMFKSGKGIWILDRGLNTVYIGDKVEDFNSLNVSSSVVVPDYNEARFTTTQGTTLVYNYYFKTWSVFTNQEAIAATNWNNAYYYCSSDGSVYEETVDSFSDADNVVVSKIQTEWFSFAGIQGFQRVYRGMILGTYVGAHNLRVKVYYDYNSYVSEEFTFTMEDAGFVETYGSESPYGTGLYGGDAPIYQFEFKPSRQKCQAMKIEISDYFPENTPTGGFKLSVLSLLVGIKEGLNKLPNSQAMTPN